MLSVKSLYTEYAGERGEAIHAAQDVSFDVPEGKLFTLLGPSGCGKTTTLAFHRRARKAEIRRNLSSRAARLLIAAGNFRRTEPA